MKIKTLTYFIFFSFCATYLFAQQTPSYTQFVFNQYGSNPAYAGTNLGMEVVTGRRIQWLGFDNAPVTTFGSFTYAWRKNFNYRAKHAIGAYVEDDRAGLFSSKAAYVSYSIHFKIFTGLNIAAGIFAGVRQVGLANALYDPNDPALNDLKSNTSLLTVYPDIIPGMRFYTKKLFIDVSVRQLYKNELQQTSLINGSTKQIGSPATKLDPTYTFVIKRKIPLGNNIWMLTPALKVQSTYKAIPLVDANIMLFYDRRVGVGASLRGNSFVSAIFQVRFLKNIVAGFGYDYTIGKLHTAAANTVEVMLSFTPGGGGDDKNVGSRSVANCPDFSY
ncbi:MAG TPA: PorP/SprF family type IX secretion system membrane protein [Bacteroidia bacterium]|nr:PorP/SprF family type IX secretion system membrane protein [Bacteroidia bacterium]